MLDKEAKRYYGSAQSFPEILEMAAKQNRFPISIDDIRDRIEGCRNDVSWSEMPLSTKIRVLLIERVEQLEAQIPKHSEHTYRTVAEAVAKNLGALAEYNRIDQLRLDALAKGDRPTELEIARIALVLGLDEGYVEQLAAKK